MHSKKVAKKNAMIRIQGPDRKGIIATVTSYLYKNNCNIEDIDQRILEDHLIMTMVVDYSSVSRLDLFVRGLQQAALQVGCEAEFKPEEKKKIKNVAILVSHERACLVDLLENFSRHKLKGRAVVVIGNHPVLKTEVLAREVPFFHVPSDKKKEHETRILELLKKFDVDLVVLARYMQILSPEFIFRYEGRIINIHPSLLPAFPGPRSYHQAYNKGVEIVGVTAHFVTTDLDEGPIITQDCFRIDKTRDTVEDLLRRGKKLEARVLTRAVKLFLEDRLYLRRGKVVDNKKMCELAETTQKFYR